MDNLEENLKIDYYLIMNEDRQQLYSKKDNKVWVFLTRTDAEKFLEKRKKIDEKQGKGRIIEKIKLTRFRFLTLKQNIW